ncbi:MAG: glycosyltransferase family 2 protein [Candidatus Woesearchaeota archaeon]
MPDKPTFSILIPTYNREKYLMDALDSVLSQTYKDYEIVVSDNHSTDDTLNVLKRYSKKHKPFRIYSQKKNLGTVRNIKFLMRKARGKYSLFLFDDDILDKKILSTFAEILSQHKDILYVYTTKQWIDKDSKTIRRENLPQKMLLIKKYGQLRTEEIFGMSGGAFKTGAVNLKDNSTAIDHILSIELSMKGDGIIYDGALYKYRFHPNNESQRADLFDTSVNVFDAFNEINKRLPAEIRKDFEVYILNQKYLLFLSSIIYNSISNFNFRKGRERKKVLSSKTKFFRLKIKGIIIFLKNSLRLLMTVSKYKQNR